METVDILYAHLGCSFFLIITPWSLTIITLNTEFCKNTDADSLRSAWRERSLGHAGSRSVGSGNSGSKFLANPKARLNYDVISFRGTDRQPLGR